MLRAILVQADESPAMEGRLQSALDLARAGNGHVTLLLNTPLASYSSLDPFGGTSIASAALEQATEEEDKLVAKLSERMAREDVSWSIDSSVTDSIDALSNASGLADVVVVSLLGEGAAGNGAAPDRLALDIDAPVLALPASLDRYRLDSKVLVAWNGSREASNALRKALPLLHLAQSVTVVSVTERDDGFPVTDAVEYLSRHGLSAELIERDPGDHSVEATIEGVADEIGAGLIVMGVYGHSRLRRWFAGSLTSYMTQIARFPLLLAHG